MESERIDNYIWYSCRWRCNFVIQSSNSLLNFFCLRVPTILQNKQWQKQKKTVTHEFMETETIMSNAKECNDVSTTIADILTTEFYSQTTQIVNFVQ